MTTTITLQLPDDFVQQLQSEAQQQNKTVEGFLAQHLTQTLRTSPKGQPSSPLSGERVASYVALAEIFSFIRAAKQFNRDRVQIPANPLALHIANLLVKHNSIRSVEVDVAQASQSMTLHLLEEKTHSPEYSLDDLLNLHTDNPELKQIFAKLKDPDPNICIQGINALGDLYSEPA